MNGTTRYTFRYGGLQDTGPGDVAIDGGDVFWTTGGLASTMRAGTVKRCSLSGASCTPVMLSSSLNASAIAVRGDVVVVGSLQGNFRMGRDGSGSMRLSGGVGATDGTTMYWGQGADVMRCAIASCVPTVIAHVDGIQSGPGIVDGVRWVHIDATSVYWMTGDAFTSRVGSIRRLAR